MKKVPEALNLLCLALLSDSSGVNAQPIIYQAIYNPAGKHNFLLVILDTIPQSLIFVFGIMTIFLIIASMLLYKENAELKQKNTKYTYFFKLYRNFADSSDIIMYLKDENFKYVYINKAQEDFYGKKSSEILGNDDYGIGDREFAKIKRESDLEVLVKNTAVTQELYWNNRVYKTVKFPVKLLSGCTGVGAYVSDVTEEYRNRKSIEKTLKCNLILVEALNKNFESAGRQLNYVLNGIQELTESKFSCIFFYGEGGEQFILNTRTEVSQADHHMAEYFLEQQFRRSGLLMRAIRKREALIDNTYNYSGEYDDLLFSRRDIEISRLLSVPVIIDDKIVAVSILANKDTDYNDEDVFLLKTIMNGVWSARTRWEAQEKLALEREKYLFTLLSIGDGVLSVDSERKIEMLNKAAEDLTGWTLEEAKGKYYREILILSNEDERLGPNDPIDEAFKTQKAQYMSNHSILTSKDGRKLSIEDSAAPIKNGKSIVGVVMVFRDVTEKKNQSRKIEFLSFYDHLTNLYNRRFFEEEMIRLNTSRNLPISIIMGDVNGLKLTNDIFGHDVGDELLKRFAKILQKVCRADDIIARLGGDEFVILLPKTDSEEAKKIIKRIKKEFAKEKIKAMKGSISMGCDTKNHEKQEIHQVLRNAEDNMYQAKSLEHNKVKGAMIQDIFEMLHEISPVEREHSVRVSQICENIGKAMDLSEVEIRKLKDAGYYHDIGKIGVDKNLLNKNGKLTEQEWKAVKKHPVIGYRILNSFDETMDLAEYVLAHHERWDQTGYPKGLRGNVIPLGARIIAVADAFEKMTSISGYNKPMTIEEAINEIEKNSGSQFDPQVVKVFVGIQSKNSA